MRGWTTTQAGLVTAASLPDLTGLARRLPAPTSQGAYRRAAGPVATGVGGSAHPGQTELFSVRSRDGFRPERTRGSGFSFRAGSRRGNRCRNSARQGGCRGRQVAAYGSLRRCRSRRARWFRDRRGAQEPGPGARRGGRSRGRFEMYEATASRVAAAEVQRRRPRTARRDLTAAAVPVGIGDERESARRRSTGRSSCRRIPDSGEVSVDQLSVGCVAGGA